MGWTENNHGWDALLGKRERGERWFYEIVERFRQKGAVDSASAMTTEELDLPPRFEEAMKKRLGRLGVFVESEGKYYLCESRLKEVEEMRSSGGEFRNTAKRIMSLRLVQLVTSVLLVIFLLANIFVQSWELRLVSAVFLVLWLLVAVLQIYYISRARKRFSSQKVTPATIGS